MARGAMFGFRMPSSSEGRQPHMSWYKIVRAKLCGRARPQQSGRCARCRERTAQRLTPERTLGNGGVVAAEELET